MNKFAVIILNYNAWRDTLKEIDLFRSLEMSQNFDIIVVDNCSPNVDGDIANKLKTECIFLQAQNNKGYGAGNNIGLKYCIEHFYKYALILNNDILFPHKDCLRKMINVIESDDMIASVNPDIISATGYLFNRDSCRPSLWDFTLGMLAYKNKGRRVQDVGGYAYVYRPQGCCMLLDIQKFASVGMFDEEIFLYCEEYVVAEKFLSKGYKCACCLTTQVIHNHSTTIKKNLTKNRINKIKSNSFSYYLTKYRRFSKVNTAICVSFYKLKLKLEH